MPYNMAVFYPFSDQLPLWQVLGTTLLILVISVAVIAMAKSLPYLFFGWLWYAITILPVIGIIQIPINNTIRYGRPLSLSALYRHCCYAGLGHSAL